MAYRVLSCLLIFAGSLALAAPPEVPKRVDVAPGQLYSLAVKGNGKVVCIPAFDTADAFFAEFVTPVAGSRLFAFHSLKPGQYVIVFLTEGEKAGAYTIFTVGGTPPIPPTPPTPPGPDPSQPAPIPVPGFRVLIVYESADAAKLPAGQQSIIYGTTIRALLNQKCIAGPDGKTREWRIWDKDTDTAGESKLWQDALTRTKGKAVLWEPPVNAVTGKTTGPATAYPWMLISNGVIGYEGPLSANPTEFAAMLAKYAPSSK